MRKVKLFLILGLLTTMFSSCCTTSHWLGMGSEVPPLTITSNVEGASVYINGVYAGKTPYTHWGSDNRKANVKNIIVKADGYYDMKQKTWRSIKGSAYWNFFPYPVFNWIWGYFLDTSNGTGWRYKQDTYHFELQKKK